MHCVSPLAFVTLEPQAVVAPAVEHPHPGSGFAQAFVVGGVFVWTGLLSTGGCDPLHAWSASVVKAAAPARSADHLMSLARLCGCFVSITSLERAGRSTRSLVYLRTVSSARASRRVLGFVVGHRSPCYRSVQRMCPTRARTDRFETRENEVRARAPMLSAPHGFPPSASFARRRKSADARKRATIDYIT
jgi:hypothetical protein